MSNLFLAHPVAFVVVVFILASTTAGVIAHALRAAVNVANDALYRRSAVADLRAELNEKEDRRFDESARLDERQDIAARLLAAWTVPHRDINGDVHHEVIDAVLIAKAYGEADLIIGMRDKTPIEIVEAYAAPEPATFAQIAARLEAEQRAAGTQHERQTS